MDRKSNGQFAPGTSGNQGGRPAIPPEVREMARAAAPGAITALIAIAANDEQPASARVSAATALLDRGYGKPAASVDMTLEGKVNLVDLLTSLAVVPAVEEDETAAPDDTMH